MIGCYIGGAIAGVARTDRRLYFFRFRLLRAKLAPACKAYMVATHCSAEPAGRMMLDALEMKAPIQAGMHLGEGTGAVTAYSLYKYALCSL